MKLPDELISGPKYIHRRLPVTENCKINPCPKYMYKSHRLGKLGLLLRTEIPSRLGELGLLLRTEIPSLYIEVVKDSV